MQEALHKGVHIVGFHLHEVQKWSNLTCGEKNQDSGCFWEQTWQLTEKGHRELSGVMGMFYICTVTCVTKVHARVKIHQMVS